MKEVNEREEVYQPDEREEVYQPDEREEVYQPDEREEVYQPEIYRLTFEHYVDCGEKRIKLDEPLVVQMAISRYEPSPVCINRMLDMMRNEVINRMGLEWRK